MTNITQIKPTKLISGDAFCLNCGHIWIAITKSGSTQLECPNCNTMKGLFKFPFDVSKDQIYRECSCGNNLFIITPNGHLCPNCGDYQYYE